MFVNKTLIAAIAVAYQSTNALELSLGQAIDDTATEPEQLGYFGSVTYQAQNRRQKLRDLWKMIDPDPNTVQTPAPYMFEEFASQFTARGGTSIGTVSDELEKKVKKVSHTQGVVAKVAWEPTEGHGFSGMFKRGSNEVIMRLSQTSMLTEDSTGLLPSMALKFLVDEHPSQNFFGMPNFTGTDSWNFFSQPMRNRVEPFTEEKNPIERATLRKKLTEASQRPYGTGVSAMAIQMTNGSFIEEEDWWIPYEVQYTSPFQFSDEKEFDADGNQVMFYDQLKRDIHEGDVIMEAWGLTAPWVLGGELIKIADIRMLSPLVTSVFGDTRLFFQHARMCRDVNRWPSEWKQLWEDERFDAKDPDNVWGREVPTGELGWPTDPAEAKTRYMDQVATHGCPFAWLLGMN